MLLLWLFTLLACEQDPTPCVDDSEAPVTFWGTCPTHEPVDLVGVAVHLNGEIVWAVSAPDATDELRERIRYSGVPEGWVSTGEAPELVTGDEYTALLAFETHEDVDLTFRAP